MAILTVGPGQQYATLPAAIAASQNGDVIQVQAGTYTNEFATITDSITIEGVGGMVNLVATEPPPNEKGILLIGNVTDDPTVTLDNLEFSGAAVSAADGGNGAGVRYQSGNLIMNDCYVHNNQDGILADAYAAGYITITNSEFADNGTTSGLTHNIYISGVGTFTITGSYVTAANTGNEIQSRARVNNVTNNRIVDGPTATASYSINLPNGGVDTVTGNIIEQGPHSQNHQIISFGTAGAYSGSGLTVSDNTIVNDEHVSDASAITNATNIPVYFTDNSVWGLTAAKIVHGTGPVIVSGTTFLTTEPVISTAPPYQTGGSGEVSTDTLVLQLSTDVPKTQFIAWLNGEELGSSQIVNAVQQIPNAVPQSGGAEDFSFSGNWGAGAETLTLENLGGTGASSYVYVADIIYNGVAYPGSSVGLLPGQTETFTVGSHS